MSAADWVEARVAGWGVVAAGEDVGAGLGGEREVGATVAGLEEAMEAEAMAEGWRSMRDGKHGGRHVTAGSALADMAASWPSARHLIA